MKMESDKKEFTGRQGLLKSISVFSYFFKARQYVPSRRVEETHVKAAMGQALNRYEQELNTIKAQKTNKSKGNWCKIA